MADTKRLPLIAGNWKMNCNHFEAIALVQKLAFTLSEKDYRHVEVAVLPPFTDLRSVQTLVDGDRLKIGYGAQDVSPHAKGAYTGDISGPMLAKLGCSYVLCGHSERRQYHHEDNALVNAKIKAALAVSITPVLCVGEPEKMRAEGRQVDHVVEQLKGSLAKIPAEAVAGLVIAYEPIWAIGTGENATPEDAQQMAAADKVSLDRLRVRHLVGHLDHRSAARLGQARGDGRGRASGICLTIPKRVLVAFLTGF